MSTIKSASDICAPDGRRGTSGCRKIRGVTFREFILETCGSERGNQAALARAIGRNIAAVTRWFEGTAKPDLPSCLAIADHYNLDPLTVMRVAEVRERDIEQFQRYAGNERPDARRLYGSRHAAIHEAVQRLLDSGLEDPVSRLVRDLAEALDELQIRLEGCMRTTGADGAQLRVAGGKLTLRCGQQDGKQWQELAEGDLTLAVRNPRKGWEHDAALFLKYSELVLQVRDLLR